MVNKDDVETICGFGVDAVLAKAVVVEDDLGVLLGVGEAEVV
jgi:hypothetical protein